MQAKCNAGISSPVASPVPNIGIDCQSAHNKARQSDANIPRQNGQLNLTRSLSMRRYIAKSGSRAMGQKQDFPNSSSARHWYRSCSVVGWCHLSFNNVGNGIKRSSSFRDLFRLIYSALVAKPALLQSSRMAIHSFIYRLWQSGFSKLVYSAP